MSLKSYFFSLSKAEREAFAMRAGTTVGVVNQLAYGNKEVELGFADALVACSGGAVTLDDVPLTGRASRQRAIRETAKSCTSANAGQQGGNLPPPRPADFPPVTDRPERDSVQVLHPPRTAPHSGNEPGPDTSGLEAAHA